MIVATYSDDGRCISLIPRNADYILLDNEEVVAPEALKFSTDEHHKEPFRSQRKLDLIRGARKSLLVDAAHFIQNLDGQDELNGQIRQYVRELLDITDQFKNKDGSLKTIELDTFTFPTSPLGDTKTVEL